MKPVDFHPRALEFIRTQLPSIRCQIGEALRNLQKGENLGMPLSRPMTVIASGVHELRVRGEGATVRVFISYADQMRSSFSMRFRRNRRRRRRVKSNWRAGD